MRASFAAVAERLSRSAAEGRFAGAVLVAAAHESLLRDAFGNADRALALPNTTVTRFRLGSVGKMFTATAALRLVQDGLLTLETRVGEVLPDYPDRDVARRVTVHQLLTHTAGLPDLWGPVFDRHRLSLRSCADYVARFGAAPASRPPGVFRYSSYGYILLGRMMEVASGLDFDRLAERLVFAPAGMHATGAPPEESDVPHRATGYRRTADGWRSAADTLPWRGTPAGGGLSTIDDLCRFADALATRQLLDAVHSDLLTAPRTRTDDDGHYGYGLMLRARSGVQTLGHTGAAPGMAAVVTMIPDRAGLIVVLSNHDPPGAERGAELLLDTLLAA